MTNDLSAEEVRALLKLEPHATCGFVRITFISNQRIAPGGLPAPFLDGRPAGSALYFMVTPDAPASLMLRIALWHTTGDGHKTLLDRTVLHKIANDRSQHLWSFPCDVLE